MVLNLLLSYLNCDVRNKKSNCCIFNQENPTQNVLMEKFNI